MRHPNRGTVDADTAAEQVVALVVKAAELLSGPAKSNGVVDGLANALRATKGIHAVSRTPRTVASIWDASRGLPGPHTSTADQTLSWANPRPRHLIGAMSRRVGSDLLVIELALPGDSEWVGDEQLNRLGAALTVIETATTKAGGQRADDPSEWLLRHGRSIVAQLMPDSWMVRSDAVTRILGYSRATVPAKRPLSLVDLRHRYTALRAYVEVLTGRHPQLTVDLRVRASDGSYRVLETTFVNLVSAPGVHSVVLYCEDVTEPRAERARMRELVNRAAGALLVVDEAGRVREVNDTFTRMFGTRVGGWDNVRQVDALRAVAAVCADGPTTERKLLGFAAAHKRRSSRLDLTDGRVLDAARVPLTERGVDLGSLWQFLDVTTGHSLSARDAKHQAALDTQNQILATVSHELRTPLTAVLSFVELLTDPAMGTLNDHQQSACTVIARNTKRLLTLVNDLLLLARLDSGQLPLRTGRVNVPRLIRDAVDDRKLEAEESSIVLECAVGAGPELIGDANRLQQVLDNVVGNALKFSAAGSTVRIRASREEGRWVIEVSDGGIGIPPEELELVTRGFERGSNAVSAGIPGSGIGLAVCCELVELHGGTLNIHSELDVGTTVRIGLPDGTGAK
ncbi:MAG: ATP-binding protein [Labedaea sp.]